MNCFSEEMTQVAYEDLFLGPGDRGGNRFRAALDRAKEIVLETIDEDETPYSGTSCTEIRATFDEVECIPDKGQGLDAALDTAQKSVLEDAIRFHNPQYLAHLNSAPTIPGIAADVLISAMNQNHAAWDLGPSVDVLKEQMIAELAELFGYPDEAGGVFTSGGTQANFMGLFLARGWYADEYLDTDIQAEGLPSSASDLRILRSAVGHPTTDEAAAKLGLGEEAVVSVPTDDQYRMDPDALERTLADLKSKGRTPCAVVGTAGTTDFGSIDPLPEIADLADEHGLWFHVDAAYGGALAVSDRQRHKLNGIERADSFSIDFHKFLFQPVSCGAFLVRDAQNYRYMGHKAEYLNPERDTVPHRTEKSVQWTRRADVLKPFVTFRALGREGVGAMVDRVVELVDQTADCIADNSDFDLTTKSEISTVVFRYCPSPSPDGISDATWANEVNDQIRDVALHDGRTVIARTKVEGTTYLKFTVLDPRMTVDDVESVLRLIQTFGHRAEAQLEAELTPDDGVDAPVA